MRWKTWYELMNRMVKVFRRVPMVEGTSNKMPILFLFCTISYLFAFVNSIFFESVLFEILCRLCNEHHCLFVCAVFSIRHIFSVLVHYFLSLIHNLLFHFVFNEYIQFQFYCDKWLLLTKSIYIVLTIVSIASHTMRLWNEYLRFAFITNSSWGNAWPSTLYTFFKVSIFHIDYGIFASRL